MSSLLLNEWSLFKFSINFDPVEKILKYLNKESDYSVKMKSFVPRQKETKHIHVSAGDLLHTVLEQEVSIGANADIAKTKQEKQIAFAVQIAQWLTTCARKPKVPGSSPAASYVQR